MLYNICLKGNFNNKRYIHHTGKPDSFQTAIGQWQWYCCTEKQTLPDHVTKHYLITEQYIGIRCNGL